MTANHFSGQMNAIITIRANYSNQVFRVQIIKMLAIEIICSQVNHRIAAIVSLDFELNFKVKPLKKSSFET